MGLPSLNEYETAVVRVGIGIQPIIDHSLLEGSNNERCQWIGFGLRWSG
jgi:hypothetical protein